MSSFVKVPFEPIRLTVMRIPEDTLEALRWAHKEEDR